LEGEKCFRERGSEGSSGIVGMMKDVIEEFRREKGEIIAV